MKQETGTGIGRALRAARLRRGKSLEEASRDTRVRIDYLGVKHDKVIAAYERAFDSGTPGPAPVERSPGVTPTEAVVLTEKKRPNWLLAAAAALIVMAAAAAIGLLNRGTSA